MLLGQNQIRYTKTLSHLIHNQGLLLPISLVHRRFLWYTILEKILKKYDLCSFCARLCELRVFGQKAKMEAGENPARSRHCIDGALSVYATEYFVFGKAR